MFSRKPKVGGKKLKSGKADEDLKRDPKNIVGSQMSRQSAQGALRGCWSFSRNRRAFVISTPKISPAPCIFRPRVHETHGFYNTKKNLWQWNKGRRARRKIFMQKCVFILKFNI
jgi:hypothetical protein